MFNLFIKIVTKNKNKRCNGISKPTSNKHLKFSGIEYIFKSRKWKVSSQYMLLEHGFKWPPKILVRRLIWKGSSSRKTRRKKWKGLLLSRNYMKEPLIYTMEVKPSLTYWFLSKIVANFSRFWTVSKRVQGHKSVWIVSCLKS